ncbi:DUF805 domain-containing protein [Polaromonas sp. JS666]|uniref:DUF805 domain-containing protein n=1 Tax=Polaromonas sp. (strain JS666 / ATCC BAA-500) TaxID=296591 RepID=UPI00087E5C4C|nr:DUF805 domain-containing protein [Polaromonas sp. JS666]SDN44841.1 Uncharacterized membrane protein YhaH, DUF805 family [Polaromonas sp. JS666]
MNFGQAISTCFSKYVTFTGRASRPEFWWFFLFQIIVLIVTGMISNILYGIAALAMLLPGIAVGVRRLHDIGKTGWLLLIGLIPVVGLLLLYWCVQPSEGPNQYDEGAAPGVPAGPTGEQ